jgi:O-antigen/teichoic acid export membrane protein
VTALGGRGLFFDTVALQSAQVLNLLLGFATISLLGNAISRSEFGVVTLVLALVNYLFVATASWNGQGYVRFGREEFVGTQRLARSFAARAALMALAALVCGGFLYWARGWLSRFVGLDLRWSLLFPSLLLLRLASDAVTTTFQVTSRFRDLALFQVGDKGLFLAAVLAAWAFSDSLSAPAVLGAFAAGKLATILLALARMELDWFRPVSQLREGMRELWQYSAPLLASSALGYLPLVAGPFIINHHVDAEEVARYNIAYQVYGFYQAITTTVLGTLLIPILTDLVTAGRDDRAGQLVGRFAGQLALLNCLAVGAVSVTAMLAFPLVLPLYEDVVPILVLLLAGSSWQIMVTVYSAMLAALKSSRPVAIVNGVGGLLFTAANWVVIPLGGALALAGTWAAWYPISAIAYLIAIRRRAGMGSATGLLPPTAALAAGLAMAAFAARPLIGVPIALLAAAGALGVARWARWFRRADLVHLERLALPVRVRRLVRAFYRHMDPGDDSSAPALLVR